MHTRWEFLILPNGTILDKYEDVATPVTLKVEDIIHKGQSCKLVTAPSSRQGWAEAERIAATM